MSETNGQSRLDRIEAILDRHSTMIVSNEASLGRIEASIERQERANEVARQRFEAENEAAHERFEDEDKRLLTAQILMNSALEKMANGMITLELKMQETTEKLNALISTVDGIIRKPDGPRA
jgi:hypothetical protein